MLHHMGNAWVSSSIFHSTGKCNKTHRMGRTWEIGEKNSYISRGMDAVFSVDSHFMVWFITWERQVFSHQFPITWEKTATLTEWGKLGKLVPGNILQNPLYVENLGNWHSYFFHIMGANIFFPLDSHPMVYFIAWKPHGFSHQISHSIRNVSKTHQNGKAWEIGFLTFSIKLMVFSITFPPSGILHQMGNP